MCVFVCVVFLYSQKNWNPFCNINDKCLQTTADLNQWNFFFFFFLVFCWFFFCWRGSQRRAESQNFGKIFSGKIFGGRTATTCLTLISRISENWKNTNRSSLPLFLFHRSLSFLSLSFLSCFLLVQAAPMLLGRKYSLICMIRMQLFFSVGAGAASQSASRCLFVKL